MKRFTILAIAAVFIFLTVLYGQGIEMMLNFLLAGVIPGTHYIVPFWVMMLGYCLAIVAITTLYIETVLRERSARATAKTTTHKQLPRRRYSNI